MPNKKQRSSEPEITGPFPAQDIFDGLMALKGADQYVKPTAGIPERHRFELHQILAATCLCGVLRAKRRWKAAYAMGLEFANGRQDFLEVGEIAPKTVVTTGEEFEDLIRSERNVRLWRERADAMHLLANSTIGKSSPWRSMVVVYAARFGDGPKATATDVIVPLKRNTAWRAIKEGRNFLTALPRWQTEVVS